MADPQTLDEMDTALSTVSSKVYLYGAKFSQLRSEVERLKTICQQRRNSASSEPTTTKLATGALIGGGIGLLFGPLGAMAGAAIGGALGTSVKESDRDQWQKRIQRANDLLGQISNQERLQSTVPSTTQSQSSYSTITSSPPSNLQPPSPQKQTSGSFYPYASFHTKVAGVTYEGRQQYVKRLLVGEKLRLLREPSNTYDRNAVAVLDTHGNTIGYLSREIAAKMAPRIDAGESFDVAVTAVTGAEYDRFGVNIHIQSCRSVAGSNSSNAPRFSGSPIAGRTTSPSQSSSLGAGYYDQYGDYGTYDAHDDYDPATDDYYDEDKYEDLTPEGLGVGDVSFDDADSDYP